MRTVCRWMHFYSSSIYLRQRPLTTSPLLNCKNRFQFLIFVSLDAPRPRFSLSNYYMISYHHYLQLNSILFISCYFSFCLFGHSGDVFRDWPIFLTFLWFGDCSILLLCSKLLSWIWSCLVPSVVFLSRRIVKCTIFLNVRVVSSMFSLLSLPARLAHHYWRSEWRCWDEL